MDGSPDAALDGIIESARRLGVEIDAVEAERWVAALAAEAGGGDIVVDVDSGIFGHRVSMLDFTARDLARFRAIGTVVGFEDRPPEVRTALALSGSAAQDKVQRFPGDCDFFERIHITAPTRAAACAILAREIRAKALATTVGPTYRLWEIKFGSYPFDGERAGAPVRAGGFVSWTADEVAAGRFEMLRDGAPVSLTWDDVAGEPGWCKLDWIVADPARGALANASNMLDVTWEAPDGTITALDGFIDPYFQEVYLEHEVLKYSTKDPNFGKVARRLYNIFRLTGRYAEAAYLRELFDEPTTVLYQVAALVRTLDEADRPGAAFDTETLLAQADALIVSAIDALEGREEVEMVRRLAAVRAHLAARAGTGGRAEERSDEVDAVKDAALEAVNAYFERRLLAVPSIATYLEQLAGQPAS
jgi:hypothetical protein